MALVPQGRGVFPDLTVIENIQVGERGPGSAWPIERLLKLFPSLRELARIIRLLREEGVTILLVEQNMKLAEAVADELHIMVKGRMVYSATPAVFRAEEETIRARFLTV